MKELYTLTYNSKTMSLDQHVTTMHGERDHLARIGVRIPDNVFAIILSNSVPQGFPDIAGNFESHLLLEEGHTVSLSDVTKALGGADVTYRRTTASAKVMKVWAKPQGLNHPGRVKLVSGATSKDTPYVNVVRRRSMTELKLLDQARRAIQSQ